MNLVALFLVIALVLFVLAGLGVAAARVNLLPFGLAFITLALLLPALS